MSHADVLSCREMATYLSDYLDGELAGSLRSLIDAHRGDCPPCEAFIRTLAKTVEIVGAQPGEPLSPQIKKNLAEALLKASRGGSGP